MRLGDLPKVQQLSFSNKTCASLRSFYYRWTQRIPTSYPHNAHSTPPHPTLAPTHSTQPTLFNPYPTPNPNPQVNKRPDEACLP